MLQYSREEGDTGKINEDRTGKSGHLYWVEE
jgi:hypothetical protein